MTRTAASSGSAVAWQVNLTPSATATYNAPNQVLRWGWNNASANNRDDLTSDPTNGAAYTWDG